MHNLLDWICFQQLYYCFGHVVCSINPCYCQNLNFNLHLAWALTAVAIKTHMPINQYLFDLLRFMAWSVLCHSSACGWDDICDRKLDAQVGQFEQTTDSTANGF